MVPIQPSPTDPRLHCWVMKTNNTRLQPSRRWQAVPTPLQHTMGCLFSKHCADIKGELLFHIIKYAEIQLGLLINNLSICISQKKKLLNFKVITCPTLQTLNSSFLLQQTSPLNVCLYFSTGSGGLKTPERKHLLWPIFSCPH